MYLVLSVTVGNRGSLEVVTLGTPKINGEMGEEAKNGWGEGFLHTEWTGCETLLSPQMQTKY